MSDDIVTRLRAYNIGNIGHEASSHMEETLYEAADEIERLRATLKKAEAVLLEGGELLKESMAEIKRWSNWAIDYACDDIKCECDRCTEVRKAWDETQRNR